MSYGCFLIRPLIRVEIQRLQQRTELRPAGQALHLLQGEKPAGRICSPCSAACRENPTAPRASPDTSDGVLTTMVTQTLALPLL